MPAVNISNGNIKMGRIPSVSLPAIKTCRKCECANKCYAAKLERFRPNVRNAYQRNLDVCLNQPDVYWREVEAAVMLSHFFRFHVSGDILNEDYFDHMVQIAQRNPHCQILAFTKRYDIVNKYMETVMTIDGVCADLPSNLHIIFSGWKNLEMDNPYNFPEAHVDFRDGTTTARPDAKLCGGNCTMCGLTETGCWTLRKGEQVVFHEH